MARSRLLSLGSIAQARGAQKGVYDKLSPKHFQRLVFRSSRVGKKLREMDTLAQMQHVVAEALDLREVGSDVVSQPGG